MLQFLIFAFLLLFFSYILNSFDYSEIIWIYISLLTDCLVEIRNYSMYFWRSLPVHSGSLNGTDYSKQVSLAQLLSLNVLLLLKELIFIFYLVDSVLYFIIIKDKNSMSTKINCFFTVFKGVNSGKSAHFIPNVFPH